MNRYFSVDITGGRASRLYRGAAAHIPLALWATALMVLLPGVSVGSLHAATDDLAASYRFLVSERDKDGGVLYRARAGRLRGHLLPLSFVDSAAYWGEYVCRLPANSCEVTDVYNPQTYTLTPQTSPGGDLQVERINTRYGSSIYDAATWQIAVMLGRVVNGFHLPDDLDAYLLTSNQNLLLQEGYNGNSIHLSHSENRAVSNGTSFVYNHRLFTLPEQSYAFRMLPASWLVTDPFVGTKYAHWLTTRGLSNGSSQYQPGMVTWTDWKPITGENAWAFLLGPLQAAYLHYIVDQQRTFVPLQDTAVANSLKMLPVFAAMQSPSGALYYAPAGTAANEGEGQVDPYEVSVENNFSVYAGLKIMQATLQAIQSQDQTIAEADMNEIEEALQLIETMIHGGRTGRNRSTLGLLYFFKELAWRDGGFIQGGRADAPESADRWVPHGGPRAVDVNTWGVAALGPRMIEEWFGFGAAYRCWQQVKQWAGYGAGKRLWGVGYSDRDGNGINRNGNYRQSVLSTEWTAGAINMIRCMINYYQKQAGISGQNEKAGQFMAQLKLDEASMLTALAGMRQDIYATGDFPGRPNHYLRLLPLRQTRPYVYASRRYHLPFGWFANPLPSTCATAWMVMVGDEYNPFAYGGVYGEAD